jgi:hypothetical protein
MTSVQELSALVSIKNSDSAEQQATNSTSKVIAHVIHPCTSFQLPETHKSSEQSLSREAESRSDNQEKFQPS